MDRIKAFSELFSINILAMYKGLVLVALRRTVNLMEAGGCNILVFLSNQQITFCVFLC